MGGRGYNAGGFAYMQRVRCTRCGASFPIGNRNPRRTCLSREKCSARVTNRSCMIGGVKFFLKKPGRYVSECGRWSAVRWELPEPLWELRLRVGGDGTKYLDPNGDEIGPVCGTASSLEELMRKASIPKDI